MEKHSKNWRYNFFFETVKSDVKIAKLSTKPWPQEKDSLLSKNFWKNHFLPLSIPSVNTLVHLMSSSYFLTTLPAIISWDRVPESGFLSFLLVSLLLAEERCIFFMAKSNLAELTKNFQLWKVRRHQRQRSRSEYSSQKVRFFKMNSNSWIGFLQFYTSTSHGVIWEYLIWDLGI